MAESVVKSPEELALMTAPEREAYDACLIAYALYDKKREERGLPPLFPELKVRKFRDTSFKPFITQVSLVETFEHLKRLKADPWQRDFCQRLQTATEKQHEKGIRALVHAPPQHGKSVILAQVFPVWLLGHSPLFRVALATYNIKRSQRHANVAIRLMQSPFYKELFPKKECHLPTIVGAENFFTNARRELNDGQASINPMGLQSGFVGTGADCLTGDSIINTEIGNIDIATLFRLNSIPRVYAFNHHTESIELREIEAIKEIETDEIIELTTTSGTVIKCTPNHRVFIQHKGYINASDVSEGDSVIKAMPSLPTVEATRKYSLSQMFLGNETAMDGLCLRTMSQSVSETTIRDEQVHQTQPQGTFLLNRLSEQIQCGGQCREVQNLFNTNAESAGTQILFRPMQENSQTASVIEPDTMQLLLTDISTPLISNSILLEAMRREGAFYSDAWQGQFTLQDGIKLRKMVYRDEAANHCTRQSQMRVLSITRGERGVDKKRDIVREKQFTDSSHRPRRSKQLARELNSIVPKVSSQASQVEEDTICLVQRIRGEGIKVYDIQVEELGNFFTDQILVHNCLIIDDPYRSAEEANSETIRENIEVFWDETSNTRLTEQANVFGMFHRYHQADLAGYLLATGEFDYWRYAAEADGDYIDDETGLVYKDPLERTTGEFLTQRPPFTTTFYEKQRKNPKTWYSQFQGKPTGEEGNTFNVKKIHVLELGSEEHERLKSECLHTGRGWDNAVSKEEGVAAFTAGVRMGITQDERILIDDIVRQRLNTAERYDKQLETAEMDGFLVPALVPIDPGSAGVDTAFQTQQMLEAEGYTCIAERVSGSKELRAYPLSLAVNSGKVHVALEDSVRQEFFKELKNFPLSTFKDQVDAGGDVYRYLFKTLKQGLVVKNYSESRNIVDRVLFNARFGTTLPEHWKIYVACRIHDDSSKPSGAVILTHAPVNTGLKDSLFVLDSFKTTGGYNQVFDWLALTLAQYEQKPVSMQLRTKSESIRTTMQMKFQMPLMLWDDDAEKGLSEMNWFLVPRETEHPFNTSEKECGLYFLREKESDALALRQECITWRYNEKGEPQEYGGILLDCVRMMASSFRTYATPLTFHEELHKKVQGHTVFATDLKDDTSIAAQISRSMATAKALKDLREDGWDVDDQGVETEREFFTELTGGW